MGSNTDVMHEYVTQEINRHYSSSDGWAVTSRSSETGYNEIVCLQRFNNSRREIVKVGVTFAKEVDPAFIGKITAPERSTDGTVSRFSSSLIVPANVQTASLPGTIPVYQMRSYGYDGENLIWLKKPVRKTDTAPGKMAAN